MRKGWEVRKLGDILTIERGGSPRPIQKYLTDSEDGLNWIKISDASTSDKYIYRTKQKIIKEGLYKTRFVKEGDFLLSNSMSFGRPYIMKTTGCIHDGWLVLREKNDFVINKEFLYDLLSSPIVFEQFNNLAAGSTVRNLNIRLVSSVSVPIPPLEEQKKIVEKLEKVFKIIDKAKANIEKNIANSKELFQSKLNEILSFRGEGWIVRKLGDILTIERGGSPRPIQKYLTDSEDGLNWIKISDASSSDKYIYRTKQKITKEGLCKTRFVKEGDFLLSNSMSFGRPYIMKTTGCIHDGWLVLREKNDFVINKEFLYGLLSSSIVFEQFNSLASGSTVRNLNIRLVSSVRIPIPPLKEQKEIVENLNKLSENIERIKLINETKLTNLQELKKSILQKAFKGELTKKN